MIERLSQFAENTPFDQEEIAVAINNLRATPYNFVGYYIGSSVRYLMPWNFRRK